MKRYVNAVPILLAAAFASAPMHADAQFGIGASSEMGSPNDGDHYYWHEPVTVKTSVQYVFWNANPNTTATNAGWSMWVEDDGAAHDTDSATNQTITTNAVGVWVRLANNRGYCQYVRPPLTSSPTEAQYHSANPFGIMWLGELVSPADTTPVVGYTILPDG